MIKFITRSRKSKLVKSRKKTSLTIECPSCNASVTMQNVHNTQHRYCWKCLTQFSFTA